MQRLERLVNLLAALISTERPLSRGELRERVPGYTGEDAAFRRAFERDKETLRAMGVPLVVEPIDPEFPDHGEGYRVPEEKYALPDPGLTRAEINALALAASAVKLKSQAAVAALWKLGGDPTTKTTDDVELTDDDRLAQLFVARSDLRNVGFTYKGKARTIDPHRMSFRNGHWYVNGFDHEYNDMRTYRLDRMEGELKLSDPKAFASPAPVEQPWLPPWQMGEELPVRARLLVDKDQAGIAVEQAGAGEPAETRADGSVVLELDVTNREAFRSFVLGFLDHAEVLGPKDLRDDTIAHLRDIAGAAGAA